MELGFQGRPDNTCLNTGLEVWGLGEDAEEPLFGCARATAMFGRPEITL